MEKVLGRNEFRARWLRAINELTNYQLQVDSWMDTSNRNPHWSFIEFMCCYFNDVDIDYQDYQNKDWVSKDEFEAIKHWHFALVQYKSPRNNDYDHLAILPILSGLN